jgi:hypothetical protein
MTSRNFEHYLTHIPFPFHYCGLRTVIEKSLTPKDRDVIYGRPLSTCGASLKESEPFNRPLWFHFVCHKCSDALVSVARILL